MKKVFLIAGLSTLFTISSGQSLKQRLEKSFQLFEMDSQLKHAISSLYVIDAKTGQVVFDKNSAIGLAPASTQKIVTAVTAFELLGKEYRYKTEIGILDEKDSALLYFRPSGDPTFGSWRWKATNENVLMAEIVKAIIAKKDNLSNEFFLDQKGWDTQLIPDGWIWQDIGNYYGAGAGILNWRENQFDLFLSSGTKIGDPVTITKSKPSDFSNSFESIVTSAANGTGDNAYIYLPTNNSKGIVRGTIPVNENNFEISGAICDPANLFFSTIRKLLVQKEGYSISSKQANSFKSVPEKPTILYKHYSPPLDSIIYWFLRKSINLYGEAIIKTISFEKQGFASTDSGVAVIKKFWKEKGLDEGELNIYDGSGLSPLNRITTHAQVEILKYARSKNWFTYFYDAIPEYNNMKMKSGTIGDVKGFCGYQKAKEGKEYIFSFLVNNYNGKASGIVNKMYKVLDELK